jgi:cytochrome c biogenesis protein CcdA/glutaredoxin
MKGVTRAGLAWIVLLVVGLWAGAQSVSTTELVLFSEEGCPQCARVKGYLDQIQAEFPSLSVTEWNIHVPENLELLHELLEVYGAEIGAVPILFVGGVAGVGGTYYGLEDEPITAGGRAEEAVLRSAVARAIEEDGPSPTERAAGTETSRLAERLTLPTVLIAAVLDSVNPCDFAVLVLLLGTLLVVGKRTKVLWAGLAFSAGIFVAYFSLGFGVFSLLGWSVGTRSFRDPFIYAVSALAIVIGLWEMKDLLWYGKWFSIEVPEKWKPSVQKFTSSVVTIPGAFVVGLIDSLFLAPCTSGPYLVILTLLSQTSTRWQGVGYLLLYNLVFILPMIGITLAVHFGLTTTARAERWRQAKLGTLHFITGLVMVTIGIGMIVAVRLGYM